MGAARGGGSVSKKEHSRFQPKSELMAVYGFEGDYYGDNYYFDNLEDCLTAFQALVEQKAEAWPFTGPQWGAMCMIKFWFVTPEQYRAWKAEEAARDKDE